MKRLIVLLFVVCLFSQGALWAADAPKSEVFAGFSALTSKSGPGAVSWVTPLGWQGSVAGSLGDKASIVGDFGGQYKSGLHSYEYMIGFRYNHRMDKINVFGHFLGGGATGGGTTGGTKVASETALMLGIGGGLDAKVAEQFAIRVIQFDWVPSRPSGSWEKNQLRFGFGVVFLAKK